MPTAFLTRRELFNAAHRLYQPGLSDDANFELYGKCSNPNWHGHNYTLWVTVKGEVDPQIGYVAKLSIFETSIGVANIDKQHTIIIQQIPYMGKY